MEIEVEQKRIIYNVKFNGERYEVQRFIFNPSLRKSDNFLVKKMEDSNSVGEYKHNIDVKTATAVKKVVREKLSKNEIDFTQSEQPTDYISVHNGDIFYGTREQFRDCFFDNANNEEIINWCKNNKWTLRINNKPIDF